jgi:hypothetical protein
MSRLGRNDDKASKGFRPRSGMVRPRSATRATGKVTTKMPGDGLDQTPGKRDVAELFSKQIASIVARFARTRSNNCQDSRQGTKHFSRYRSTFIALGIQFFVGEILLQGTNCFNMDGPRVADEFGQP